MISEPSRRPDNAPNWLPLGAYEGWPNIRQFLPAADFDEAVEHLEAGEDLAQAMGEYFPL